VNTREKFLAVMHGEPGSHTVKWEFGYWAGALRRWYAEGLLKIQGIPDDLGDGNEVYAEGTGWTPASVRDMDVHVALGMDEGNKRIPVWPFIYPPFERQVLEDHGDWQLVRREDGMIAQERVGGTSVPRFVRGPVGNWADWNKLREERLQPNWRSRLMVDWETWVRKIQDRTYTVSVGAGGMGFYGGLRALFGDEQVLYAFYDQPDLVREIVSYLADFWIALYDPLLSQVRADYVIFWEDMAYKGGSLISPKMFREFLLLPYQRLTGFFREHGLDIMLVDCDGDVRQLIPVLKEAGVTGLFPFEVTAGQNIVEIRQQYPDLHILGGIDKKALAAGREAVDRELEKVPFMLRQGRYVPYVDHFVPPDVSWDTFKYYRTRLNEMIDAYATT